MQSGQGVSNTATASIAAKNLDANLIRLETVGHGQLNSGYMATQLNNQPQLMAVPQQATQYITVQTAGGYQLLPIQGNNNSTQYIQLQLPNVQQGNNFVQIQPNSVQSIPKSPNHNLVPLQPQTNINSIQQLGNFNQKVSIQLVQQSGSQSIFTAPIAGINSLNTITSQNQQVLASSSVSLVGSISTGLNTPIIRIGKLASKQPSAAVCNSVTTNTSLLKTLKGTQQISSDGKVQSLISNVSFPTGNGNQFRQSLSGATTPVFVSQTNSNDQKAFQGTIMVMGDGAKQTTVAPKAKPTNALQQNSVFVPITVANNVSVLTNPVTGKAFTHIQPGTVLKLQQQIAPRVDQMGIGNLSSIIKTSSATPSTGLLVTPEVQQQQQQQLFINHNSNFNQQTAQLQLQTNQQQGSQQIFFNTIPQNLQLNPQPKVVIQKSKQTRNNANSISKTPLPSPVISSSSSSIAETKPLKKPCNCTKSQCLKLYCECFANGEFCSNCNCRMCLNNINHEEERSKAIKSCLDRNPYAFHPKIGKGKVKGDNERRHTKGCNCKRSGCLKNYCECYEAKILCSSLCRCSGCKNFEESHDRKTLMHLADAAEVCVQQQNAAKTKLANQIDIVPKKVPNAAKENLPVSFLTANVSKATCDILMATAAECEAEQRLSVDIEKSIIFEFSRCLDRIINQSHKAQKEKRR